MFNSCLIHILKTDVWRLQIGCTCLEVAAYQVAVWLQAPINIYIMYGGCTRRRMAVVSGCSLVADRLQHEKPDTTKQENKQTSKQTYGGRIRLQSGCTCLDLVAVVWRLHPATYGGRRYLRPESDQVRHKPTSVAAEARASMPQWVFVAK